MLEACRRLGGCETGAVAVTEAFDLASARGTRFIVHAVGPVWRGGSSGEDELLASCYRRALQACVARGLSSIAFPAISTGAYRFPLERATSIALRVARAHVDDEPQPRRLVYCCFSLEIADVYARMGAEVFD